MPTCTVRFWVASVVAAASIASLVLLREVAQRNDEHAFGEHHVAATFLVRSISEGDHRCCDQVGCTCTEANPSVATCAALILNLTEGACDGGYRCCQTVCDTCWDTCWRTCCDTCHGTRSTCTGSPSHCTTTSYSYDCNCHMCSPYPCNPHDCNCRCAHSVARQACNIVCGTCYSPRVLLNTTAATGDFFVGVDCGRDDTVCLSAFLSKFTVGAWLTGTFDPGVPGVVRLDVLSSAPRYAPGASLVAGYVLLSLLGFITLVVAVKDARTFGLRWLQLRRSVAADPVLLPKLEFATEADPTFLPARTFGTLYHDVHLPKTAEPGLD